MRVCSIGLDVEGHTARFISLLGCTYTPTCMLSYHQRSFEMLRAPPDTQISYAKLVGF